VQRKVQTSAELCEDNCAAGGSWIDRNQIVPVDLALGFVGRSIGSIASVCQAKELSMMSSNMGSIRTEIPQETDVIADGEPQGPMLQQDAVGSHGHEMHPQKFVRLVGCHDSNAAKHEAEYPLH
jgi:hypothetical protein